MNPNNKNCAWCESFRVKVPVVDGLILWDRAERAFCAKGMWRHYEEGVRAVARKSNMVMLRSVENFSRIKQCRDNAADRPFYKKDEGPIVRHFGCLDGEKKRVGDQTVDKGLYTGLQIHDYAAREDTEGRGGMTEQ